jgi:hypothetical protein
MDNLEKLALLGTQDEEKQNKNTTQYVGHHYAQTNTNNVNKTRAKAVAKYCQTFNHLFVV